MLTPLNTSQQQLMSSNVRAGLSQSPANKIAGVYGAKQPQKILAQTTLRRKND